MKKKINLLAQNSQSTVVAEYIPDTRRVAHYQSEAELEHAFIKELESQAYEFVTITSEEDLVLNLRKQLEKLNSFSFSDSEWNRFFVSEIANPNQSIEEKTAKIQEGDTKFVLTRDNGEFKNIMLLDG